ncbi:MULTISPECIES: hypothetical protein [unclassified Streptomyces]|uniref:hypothetical protein n=1 Tax=unclassified Streptomyces TaxID=2593676 RepID=UPI00131CA54D|nr:hypothetical protein [Streptomyces sp. CB01635]
MTQEAAAMRLWRFVVRSGTVSFVADPVYEGARSVTGPSSPRSAHPRPSSAP